VLSFSATQLGCFAADYGQILDNSLGGAKLTDSVGGYTGFDKPNANRANLNFDGNALLKWDALNVGNGQTLHFNNGGYTVLNTVINGMSTFAGAVSNTGKGAVVISNPNGMVMTDGASFAMQGPLTLTTQRIVNFDEDTGAYGLATSKSGKGFIKIEDSTLESVGELVLMTRNGSDFIAVNNSTITVKEPKATQAVVMHANGDIDIVNLTVNAKGGETVLKSKGNITVDKSTFYSDLTAEALKTVTKSTKDPVVRESDSKTTISLLANGVKIAEDITEAEALALMTDSAITYEIEKVVATPIDITKIVTERRGDIKITDTNVYGDTTLTAHNITLNNFGLLEGKTLTDNALANIKNIFKKTDTKTLTTTTEYTWVSTPDIVALEYNAIYGNGAKAIQAGLAEDTGKKTGQKIGGSYNSETGEFTVGKSPNGANELQAWIYIPAGDKLANGTKIVKAGNNYIIAGTENKGEFTANELGDVKGYEKGKFALIVSKPFKGKFTNINLMTLTPYEAIYGNGKDARNANLAEDNGGAAGQKIGGSYNSETGEFTVGKSPNGANDINAWIYAPEGAAKPAAGTKIVAGPNGGYILAGTN